MNSSHKYYEKRTDLIMKQHELFLKLMKLTLLPEPTDLTNTLDKWIDSS